MKSSLWSFACILTVALTPGFSQAQSLSPSQSSAWTSGGPFVGEAFRCLVASPADPDILFAGGDLGFYQSPDGGATWVKRLDNGIRTIAISAANPDHIYASDYPGEGILKSEDGGLSWTEKGLANATVNALVVHPTNPDVVYAGTGEDARSYASEVLGVFKSEDGGDSWMLKTDDEIDAVLALLLDTSNPDHVYAGVSPNASPSWDGRLFRRSTDGGETWEKFLPPKSWHSVHTMAMTPAGHSPPTIYAMSGGDDIYMSVDFGVTWTDLDAPISYGIIAVDPRNPKIVYAAYGADIYRSLNGGGTWSQVGVLNVTCSPSDVVLDAASREIVVSCLNGQGLYRSEDQGASWGFVGRAVTTTNVRYLAAHPEDAERVYAVLPGNSGQLAVTTDGGVSWSTLESSPVDLGAVSVDPQNPSSIWVGRGYGLASLFYIHNSQDFGSTWTPILFAQSVGGNSTMEVTDILVHPDKSDFVLVGTNFLITTSGISGSGLIARSFDGGVNWGNAGGASSAMSFDAKNPNIVYNGKQRTPQVFMTTDIWGNWQPQQVTPPGIGDVNDIKVGMDSDVYVAASNGLWKRVGNSWTRLTSLPSNNVTALAIDLSASPGVVYAGTSSPGGVFVSVDGGDTWIDYTDGEDLVSVNQLVLSERYVYAAPYNGSVWKREAVTGVAIDRQTDLPVAYHLLQNYPNPFNPTTTISYDLPQTSNVTLTVVNVLGRQIRELASGTRLAGNYEGSFDAGGLPSGVYFYRLQAGDYVETKRMVILK